MDARGGDTSVVAAELTSGVTSIAALEGAFVATKTDGTEVRWGDTSNENPFTTYNGAQLLEFTTGGAYAALVTVLPDCTVTTTPPVAVVVSTLTTTTDCDEGFLRANAGATGVCWIAIVMASFLL